MQVVYEAANTLDANIVLNMLRADGIDGRIDGEFLQGGMGELPVAGLVRVLVEEADVEAARAIIRAWERGGINTDQSKSVVARSAFPKEFAIVLAAVVVLILWTWLAHAL